MLTEADLIEKAKGFGYTDVEVVSQDGIFPVLEARKDGKFFRFGACAADPVKAYAQIAYHLDTAHAD